MIPVWSLVAFANTALRDRRARANSGAPHTSTLVTMARRWQTVTVELVHGRGETLDRAPGRVMLLPPRTTFDQLGEAIDLAFARWDLAHPRLFVLQDGAVVCDEESALDELSDPDGALQRTIPLEEPVKQHVSRADERFFYVFDFGDNWTHVCTFDGYADPTDVYGPDPTRPVPIEGWGTIPDQYGRRWRDDLGRDDDDTPPPPPPELDEVLVPLAGMRWPASPAALPPVDLAPFRVAHAARDVVGFLAAVGGVDLEPAIQQLAAMALTMFRASAGKEERLAAFLISLHALALRRAWDGDDLLAEDIRATLEGRDTAPPLRSVPVDLGEVVMQILSGGEEFRGGYVNIRTGEAISEMFTDAGYVGDDAVVDVEEDEAWRWVPATDSDTGWRDMQSFAEGVAEPDLRERLLEAIQGRGAFRRFKDVLHRDADESLRARWYLESEDRDWGRARETLAGLGIRPE